MTASVRRTGIALAMVVMAACTALWVAAGEAFGGSVSGARLERAQRSPQWQDDAFTNRLPRVDGPLWRSLWSFTFGGSPYRVPTAPIPVIARTRAEYRVPPASGLRVTWLGHSTLLLEQDGHRVLIDPVWGERASPFTFAGPARFHAPPLPLAELPPIDAVVISHDHYDHLDLPTVQALRTRGIQWFVPLGVGAHLAAWGIPEARITELDWWQASTIGSLTITATPARHFSGRSLFDANRTLWAGWVFTTSQHRVFYSGDTAMHPEFADIGARLGPFDLTMIEAGAYNALWADVHLGPEQAVAAHTMVRGGLMLPVHWGLFDLALHGWTEPIERVRAAAAQARVRVATPRPGEMIEPAAFVPTAVWWPAVPWESAAVAPVWSSGVPRLGVPVLGR